MKCLKKTSNAFTPLTLKFAVGVRITSIMVPEEHVHVIRRFVNVLNFPQSFFISRVPTFQQSSFFYSQMATFLAVNLVSAVQEKNGTLTSGSNVMESCYFRCWQDYSHCFKLFKCSLRTDGCKEYCGRRNRQCQQLCDRAENNK